MSLLDQKTGHVWDVVFRFGEMNKQKPGFIPNLFSEMVYSVQAIDAALA